MQLFGSGTVCQLTGASMRELGYWIETGLLKPSGKGTVHHRFTFPDLVAAKTVVALRREGCSLQKVRKAVKYLRVNYPADESADALSGLTLLTDGQTVYLYSDAKRIMDVLSKQTVLWMVNVGRLILAARADAAALPLEWIVRIKVGGETYRLRVSNDPDSGGYTAQCVELPGAIEQGDTPDEALANGKAAVESVLAFMAKRSGGRSAPRVKRHA